MVRRAGRMVPLAFFFLSVSMIMSGGSPDL
jgi:hypothetical protein